MRLLLIVALFALAPVYAAAQTQAAPPSIPRSYPTPPSTLATPQALDIESVRAARGNLGRWRDSERQRLGPYSVDERTGVARNGIGEVGGYFVFFGDGDLPGGIVEATWQQPAAAAGQAGALWTRYILPRTICEASLQRATSDISELTYLGPEWRAEFGTLDSALLRAAPAATGRELAEGVTVSWVGRPELSRFYPQRAMERETEGLVEISCLVRADFRLACGTVSETPPGWGFSEATQRAMRTVRAEPTTSSGESSVGVCFPRRIRWALVR